MKNQHDEMTDEMKAERDFFGDFVPVEESEKGRYREFELSPSGREPSLQKLQAAVALARASAPTPDDEESVEKHIQATVVPQLDRIFAEAAEERARWAAD